MAVVSMVMNLRVTQGIRYLEQLNNYRLSKEGPVTFQMLRGGATSERLLTLPRKSKWASGIDAGPILLDYYLYQFWIKLDN
jgi:hypothetical protein